MSRKKIGETFSSELAAAGLLGLPFSWGEDGSFTFGTDMPEGKKVEVLEVYSSHDPKKNNDPAGA